MSKQKKIKLIFTLVFIILGTVANIYFSTFLHQVLSNEVNQVTSLSFNFTSFLNCISSLKTSKNHFMLFISFEILIILASLFFLIANDKPYQSNLIKVTPNISIPASAGQKQFGSAKFMAEKEKEKAFPVCMLNKKDKLIDYLIRHGYDDLSDPLIENKEGDKND